MEDISVPGGRYKLLRELGRGSEGCVFLVFQESTFRFFAAKIIRKDGTCYSREGIEIWKQLRCKDMPEIRDILETEETLWIIMDYIDGMTLTQWIKNYGKPSWLQGVLMMLRICRGIRYLHEQSTPVIFGDLKSDNIMIRKKMPVLVDLGSVHLLGSKTKRTGTLQISVKEREKITEEKQDLICLGIIAEQMSRKRRDVFGRFARKAFFNGTNGFTSAKQCQRYLRKQILSLGISWVLFFMAGGIGLSSAFKLVREEKNRTQDTYYEELLSEAKRKTDGKFLEEGMKLMPDNERAYLESLDRYLEDLNFSREEYADFIRQWEETDEKGKTKGELLFENPSGYAQVVYKTALCCWYFYTQREGTYLAMDWFKKMKDLPEELRRDSDIYLKLGEYRDKTEMYKRTGEDPNFFCRYLEELNELKFDNENEYFNVCGIREKALFLIHYMVELKKEGYLEISMERQIDEIDKRISDFKNSGEETEKIAKEVADIIPLLKEMKRRLYGENEESLQNGFSVSWNHQYDDKSRMDGSSRDL